jgi:predicted ABC-type transport system involved in lysophospholipase L1 biosynthesis ATPase subunit
VTFPSIVVQGLSHRFSTRDGLLTVLDGLDLEVAAGGYVTLTGPSGAGKSTLLSLLGGLEPPQEGSVVVDGHDLSGLSRNQLATFRCQTVGFVFQHFGLLATLSAAENVELACMLAGAGPRARRRRTGELLDAVGLAARAGHRPGELSGGERQRVAIARALANRPQVVLADEPTGNLDDDSATMVIELLESLPAEHGCTLVVVTHNRGLAARATRLVTLAGGRLREVAPV